MQDLKKRLFDYYERHEATADAIFFLGGFVFDVFTLSSVDDSFAIAQQVLYLAVIGLVLCRELLVEAGVATPPLKMRRAWDYRRLIVHFLMGSLLSVYSLFFLKSSSFFSSFVFVIILMGLMVANELKVVQRSTLNVKLGLFVVCVISFFSVLVPTILGFVGWVPFGISLGLTGLTLWGLYRILSRGQAERDVLRKHFVIPGSGVCVVFTALYVLGWIPPVPLSVQDMGIFHQIEKVNGEYRLYHETPRWKFWNRGDQEFLAAPGDKICFFARIFSPGRFADEVILHWQHHDSNGWESTDRIPMKVTGGRVEGYRGHAFKQNFDEGSWRIKVETTDGRELGRIYLDVKKILEAPLERAFVAETR